MKRLRKRRMRRSLSSIYRSAARNIYNRKVTFVCAALFDLPRRFESTGIFHSYFKPDGIGKWSIYFGDNYRWDEAHHRIMALLLLAEIEKDV